jgi:hypothetical protein
MGVHKNALFRPLLDEWLSQRPLSNVAALAMTRLHVVGRYCNSGSVIALSQLSGYIRRCHLGIFGVFG